MMFIKEIQIVVPCTCASPKRCVRAGVTHLTLVSLMTKVIEPSEEISSLISSSHQCLKYPPK